MKATLITLLVLVPGVFALHAEDTRIQKVYEKSKTIKLKVASGDCLIGTSTDGKIHVDLTYSFDKKDYEPTFNESGETLELGEKYLSNHSRGRSKWTVSIPDGLKFEFHAGSGGLVVKGPRLDLKTRSGSGNIDIQDAKGDFRLSSGSGDVKVFNCEIVNLSSSAGSGDHEISRVKGKIDLRSGSGDMKVLDTEGDLGVSVGSGKIVIRNAKGNLGASTGSGSIRAENLTLVEKGSFSSGSGDVDVDMPSGDGFRLKVSAGSGDTRVRLNGKPAQGFFEFSASKKHGTIVSCEPFDKEEEIQGSQGSDPTMRKSFTRGKSTNQVVIRTGSGKAELSK
jgi:hypothetical protein